MGPAPKALLALALLLPALAHGVLAQAPAPSEALPGELLALGHGWVDRVRARTDALRAQGTVNATSPEGFAASADRFVNESRLTVAMTQVYQAHVADGYLAFQRATPNGTEARRAALLDVLGRAENTTHAGWDDFVARLRAYDQAARTTHGVEYATLATLAALEADASLDTIRDSALRVRNATQAGDDLVLLTLFAAEAPGAYLGFANDLLALAARVDQDAARPQLQAGALDAMLREAQKRFTVDPDSSSLPGPLSSKAIASVVQANRTGPRLLVVGRFVAFEEARAQDAVDFLVSRASIDSASLRDLVAQSLANASLVPRYDARFDALPSPVARLRNAGYQAVVVVDARNHAAYRVAEDPSLGGMRLAWSELVGARYAAETLAEARGGRAQGLDPSLALYGGIAVAAALVVVAVGLLRK